MLCTAPIRDQRVVGDPELGDLIPLLTQREFVFPTAVAISALSRPRGAAACDGADFAGEQAWLFPGGEVTAPGGLVPVHDVGEAALGLAAGGPGYFIGEDAAPGRDGDGVAGGGGEPFAELGDAFPVQAGRRRTGAG